MQLPPRLLQLRLRPGRIIRSLRFFQPESVSSTLARIPVRKPEFSRFWNRDIGVHGEKTGGVVASVQAHPAGPVRFEQGYSVFDADPVLPGAGDTLEESLPEKCIHRPPPLVAGSELSVRPLVRIVQCGK